MPVVRLRPATVEDIPMLRRWDLEPHMIDSDPNSDWDYEDEIGRDLPGRAHFIAEADGEPVGFMEFTDPEHDESRYWGEMGPGFRALDIWIGPADRLGQGLGTAMMREAIARCFAEPGVHTILIDPLETNTDAIRFYERIGFRFVEIRRFGDDVCAVHRLLRSAWERGASETSASIAAWAETTFGPAPDLTALSRRARQELDELEDALRAGDNAEAIREAADVVILLHRVCGLLGADLDSAVNEKMQVNRARKWRLSGDGVGQHEHD